MCRAVRGESEETVTLHVRNNNRSPSRAAFPREVPWDFLLQSKGVRQEGGVRGVPVGGSVPRGRAGRLAGPFNPETQVLQLGNFLEERKVEVVSLCCDPWSCVHT